MVETEYVAGGKVQVGIFPKNCVYTNLREPNLGASIGKRLRYVQEDFEAGKGVKEPCWNCLYNNKPSGGGICKVSRVGFREDGKEFLIRPRVEDPVLT